MVSQQDVKKALIKSVTEIVGKDFDRLQSEIDSLKKRVKELEAEKKSSNSRTSYQ
ncbi:hypothetical protein ACIQ4I_05470 [Rummeliibacillus sp. NPDC094406]|uniref:hypothetical protein n=1 Tax=Rummeliibacillus sp. NPDC094406 TaxID=3364511 RepID=UPI00380CA8D8